MSFYGRQEANRDIQMDEHDPSRIDKERAENFVEVSNNEDSIANEIAEDLEALDSTVLEMESVEDEGQY